MPQLHAELAPIAFLVGVWEGDGSGDSPNCEPFTYRERTTFTHDGRPFLYYEQSTWRTGPDAKEMPSHNERGMWRGFDDGRVEAVIAQTGGIGEVAVGRAEGNRLQLDSTTISSTPSAKEVRGLWRVYTGREDMLVVDVDMAAMGSPRVFHLHAELRQSAMSTITGA